MCKLGVQGSSLLIMAWLLINTAFHPLTSIWLVYTGPNFSHLSLLWLLLMVRFQNSSHWQVHFSMDILMIFSSCTPSIIVMRMYNVNMHAYTLSFFSYSQKLLCNKPKYTGNLHLNNLLVFFTNTWVEYLHCKAQTHSSTQPAVKCYYCPMA